MKNVGKKKIKRKWKKQNNIYNTILRNFFETGRVYYFDKFKSYLIFVGSIDNKYIFIETVNEPDLDKNLYPVHDRIIVDNRIVYAVPTLTIFNGRELIKDGLINKFRKTNIKISRWEIDILVPFLNDMINTFIRSV